MSRLSLAMMLALAVASTAAPQDAAPRALVPIDAVSGVVDAFRVHPIVGLSAGDGHGDLRGPAFVVSLIRDPRFAAVANDIVMEGASGRYQDVMDRYVRGDDVPAAALRPTWDERLAHTPGGRPAHLLDTLTPQSPSAAPPGRWRLNRRRT